MNKYLLDKKFEIIDMIDTNVVNPDNSHVYSYVIKARGKTIMNYETSVQALTAFIDAQTDLLTKQYGNKYTLKYNTNVDVGAGFQASKFSDTSEIFVYDIYVSYEGVMQYIKERVDDETYLKYENVLKTKKEDIKFVDNQFIVNVYKVKSNLKSGGYSKNKDKNEYNDCLYYCLKNSLEDIINLPWSFPSTFKTKFLKLNRNDLVDISYIPQIEDKLKTNIEVEGDVCYKALEKKYSRNIKLFLLNNHYKNTYNKTTHLCKKMKEPVKDFLLYDNKFYYDGLSVKSKGKNDFLMKPPNDLLCFYVVPKILEKYKSFEAIYKQLHKEREIMLKKLKIDIFNFKTVKNFTLDYFNQCATTLKEPTPISQQECELIENAKGGGMYYCKKGKYDYAIDYDVNAYYSYLSIKSLYLPIDEPEYLIINEINKKFVPFGYIIVL